jgi:transposase-like protein
MDEAITPIRAPGARGKYDETVKSKALLILAKGQKTQKQVAEEVGVPLTTLSSWIYEGKRKPRTKKVPRVDPALVPDPGPERLHRRILELEDENAALLKVIVKLAGLDHGRTLSD